MANFFKIASFVFSRRKYMIFILVLGWTISLSSQSTHALMTGNWHVVAKLLTVDRMSELDYQNKVLSLIYS